jgi:hypothetical protein
VVDKVRLVVDETLAVPVKIAAALHGVGELARDAAGLVLSVVPCLLAGSEAGGDVLLGLGSGWAH